MIKLKNINKYYFKNKSNEIHVLNNVDLQLDEIGLTTILGPSGSGKSTLLHVIGGLDKAQGTIQYEEQTFERICNNQMDLYRNKYIGYIFQNYHLLPDLTVYQNLKLQLELIGIDDEEEIEKRINICLKAIGMEKYKRRNVTALSGGQQQRIAIARALVKGAKVIIADEPTGNLDSRNSIEVMNILKRLSKKCLIVLVTHNKELAYHYSDRILKIKDGCIISDEINENNNTFMVAESDNIYLDQFKKEDISSSKQTISLYTNKEQDVQINIVIDNNVIYIENNQNYPIKVIGETTDKKIKAVKPKEEMVTEEKSIVFDNEIKIPFRKKVKNLLVNVKNAIMSFLFANKKAMLVNLSFFLIGALICAAISALNYSTAVDDRVVRDYPGYAVRVDAKKSNDASEFGYSFEYEEVEEIIKADNGAIGIVDVLNNVTFSYKYMGNRQTRYIINHQCYAATPYLVNYPIELTDNEIAISSVIAEELLGYFSTFGVDSKEKLLNTEFDGTFLGVYSGNIKIKEIVDINNYTIIFSDNIYYMLFTFFSSNGQGITYRSLKAGENLENLVTIPTTTSYSKVYLSNNLEPYYKQVSRDGLYEIAGYFDSKDFEMVFLVEDEYEGFVLKMLSKAGLNILPYETGNFKLIEGHLPIEDNEVILPDILKNSNPIGSTHYTTGCEVVGFFKSSYPTNTSNVYTNMKVAYEKRLFNVYNAIKGSVIVLDFYTNDPDKLIEYFKENGHEAVLVEKMVLENATIIKMDESHLAIIVSTSISLVMIVFIFFMSRSKMMHNIYNIGVYRSLGAKKERIYNKYLLDSIIMSTFTAVLGFLITYIAVSYLDNSIASLHIPGYIALIVIVALYVIMIVSSLMPIYSLLRKTPIEIIGKYDI